MMCCASSIKEVTIQYGCVPVCHVYCVPVFSIYIKKN